MVIDSDAPPQNPVAEFEDFFKTFEDTPNNFKYRRKISEAFSKSENFIVVLFEDILNFNPSLANFLKNTPEQALKDAAESFKNILRIDSGGQLGSKSEYFVRISTQNNSNEVKLRLIRSKHVDTLIFVRGIVIRTTQVLPQITVAAFECPACGNIMQQPQVSGKIKNPRQCTNPNCSNNKDFTLNSENSEFIDHQIITVQESPEELRPGSIPQTLYCVLHYDNVDAVRPGERVAIMGILKTTPQEEGQKGLSTVCKVQLFVNFIEGLEQAYDEADLSSQDLEEIHALSIEPLIQKKIARSIARTIMGHEQLKMAAALSLFAGIQKIKKDGSKIRGDIHVLFMGDPGTGKSQILQNCALIAPRSIYTSGKGATAAGLTAAVVRENDRLGMQLEAGAIVLASGGVACTTGDTEFILNTGERMSFETLFKNEKSSESIIYPSFRVYGLNVISLKIEPFNIKKAFRIKNSKKIFQISTQSGRIINLTEDNEVLTSENSRYIWKETGKMQINEYIAVPKEISQKKTNHYSNKYLKPQKDSEIFWDKIIKMEPIESKYVYDFTMDGTNNFIGNDFIQHNCIDEFDKMRPEDRVAIHEAMEQQSYHPSFELKLANGDIKQIGDFVDKLFLQYVDQKIDGINCEILPLNHLNHQIITTDFNKIFKTNINRISRHAAPQYFMKITFSNGRSILVTPEHPIFIFENSGISTIGAEKLKGDEFVPGPKDIKFEETYTLNTNFQEGRKNVSLPEKINVAFAQFLGYYVSEGYSYLGSSAEVGLSNTNVEIIEKMKYCIENVFHITPIDNIAKNRTIRIISKTIFEFLHNNFPELMKKSFEKRIPKQIFASSDEERRIFLQAAFEGDGGVESTALAYSTTSEFLAYDYQDLLLTYGIYSRITKDLYTFGEEQKEQRFRYKVYITGDSQAKFIEMIIPEIKKQKKVQELLEKSDNCNRKHDVIPTQVALMIRTLFTKIGIAYDGYFNEHLEKNYGINREVFERYLIRIREKIQKVENYIASVEKIAQLRELIGYSQEKLASILLIKRGHVDYIENGGYSEEKKTQVLIDAKNKIKNEINQANQILKEIENLLEFRWLRIKSIEKVLNDGDLKTNWVYDVTIEPTKCFISHGLILHNTISIAKAGIVATLQAKTAIIAAANPKSGRYDDYATPSENINLPPTIMSRFDLIFVVRDKPERNTDDRIAEHILESHMEGFEETYIQEDDTKTDGTPKKEEFIPMELLKKYIRYAKKVSHPRLTKEVAKKIRDYYVDLRNSNADGTVSIVARTLEGMIRMTEAYAKMALRDIVTIEDVDSIIELVNRSLHDIGYDQDTNKIDMDRLLSGISSNKRQKMMTLLNKIKDIQSANPDASLTFEDIYESVASIEGMKPDFVKEALENWAKEGTLYHPKMNEYKLPNIGKGKKKIKNETDSPPPSPPPAQ